MSNIATESSARNKVLAATTALGFGTLAVSMAATQLIAYKTGYHPSLGGSLFSYFGTQVYAPWEWWTWMHAPFAGAIKNTLELARLTLMGGGLAMAGAAVMAISRGRRKPKAIADLHGSSRWARLGDVREYGLLDVPEGSSVYLGEFVDEDGNSHALRDGGNGHVAGIAPTRSGKGVSWVLPTMFTWNESMLVNDEKGELIALTQGHLTSQGHAIHRWQPGSPDQCDATYNFLDSIRIGTDYEVSDSQNIAILLVDPEGKGFEGKDAHWRKTAYALLSGLCLFAKTISANSSLADVAAVVCDPGTSQDRVYQIMAQSDNAFVAQTAQIVLTMPRDERGSVVSTMRTAVEMFRDPIVVRNTSSSNFTIESLVRNRSALFMITPGLDLLRLRPLKRLMISAIMRTLMSKPLEFVNGQPLQPYPFKLLVPYDEFPSDGNQPMIEAALPKCAAWGIKLMLIMQDTDQLRAAYGPNQSILSNCAIRMVLAPNNFETASWVSKMTGMQTIVQESYSESGKRAGSLSGVSRSLKEVGRPLLTPDEVMRMRKTRGKKPGEMLAFVEGGYPIRMLQTPYYLSPRFKARAGA